jgi:hypothetical protein
VRLHGKGAQRVWRGAGGALAGFRWSMSDHLIRISTDWAAVFRARAAELGLSHFEIDQRADLPLGYTNKIVNGKKKPGAVTIERLCRALKLAFKPIADVED